MGRRRMAAWTALQWPWKWCNQGDERYMDKENREHALSHDFPPMVKGMDKEALGEFFHSLTAAEEFGYDPETDYRKSPVTIHHFVPIHSFLDDRELNLEVDEK